MLAEAGCTSHVFWQALDESRFVIAWYGRGTRIVDFSDPANPRQIGSFVPTGGDTWSAKPHRGFIFTGDIDARHGRARLHGRGQAAVAHHLRPRGHPARARAGLPHQGRGGSLPGEPAPAPPAGG